MPSCATKNEAAWKALFERYGILEEINRAGTAAVSAEQIREYREPRLMAKFDHRINLPRLFADNDLAILPVSRGKYLIARFAAYHAFELRQSPLARFSLPAHIRSLNPDALVGETLAINAALASGILEDFLEEADLCPTVAGRMGSGSFGFRIDRAASGSHFIEVRNAQLEIDAAFEGRASLALLEAKCSLADDFMIRQIYYPYRLWSMKLAKAVRPVFLVYSNGIFSLYEYSFCEKEHYNSLVLKKYQRYSLEDTAIRSTELLALARHTQLCPEPDVPFPQADSFSRVINLCELLMGRSLSREQVTEEYAFDLRQTNYYTDAARYLGLLEKERGRDCAPQYRLSAQGEEIMRLPYRQRQLALCRRILEHGVFSEAFRACEVGALPDRRAVVGIMKRAGLRGVQSESTYERRASTVTGWLTWMIDLTRRN